MRTTLANYAQSYHAEPRGTQKVGRTVLRSEAVTLPNGENERLSLVLPLRGAARQAEKALASLSPPYQDPWLDGVEILVIEAPSADMLGEERARAGREHVRYFQIGSEDAFRTRSLELGLRESRAPHVGVFMDAAHVVTPRTLDTAFRAFALSDKSLVALPEYRLDETRVSEAGTADAERTFLEQNRWKKHPYDLFSFVRFGPANPNGFLGPLLGAACLFAAKEDFEALLPLDRRYDMPGAAALKLWVYTELSRLPRTRLIVLAGEGAIRLHHPELEIAAVIDEERSVQTLVVSAASAIQNFRAVHREPLVFGTIPGPLLPFVAESAGVAEFHCVACRGRGEPPWYEDP